MVVVFAHFLPHKEGERQGFYLMHAQYNNVQAIFEELCVFAK